MLTLSQFEAALQKLQNFKAEQEKLDAVLQVISPTSTGVVEFGGQFMEDYIELLSLACNDSSNWVGWFVYECRFGKHPMECMVGNTTIKVDTPEKLYQIICA